MNVLSWISGARFKSWNSLTSRFLFWGGMLILMLLVSACYALVSFKKNIDLLESQLNALERLEAQVSLWFESLPDRKEVEGGDIARLLARAFGEDEGDPRFLHLASTLGRLRGGGQQGEGFESRFAFDVMLSQSFIKQIREEAQRSNILMNSEIAEGAKIIFIDIPNILDNVSKQYAVVQEGEGRRDSFLVGLEYLVIDDVVRMDEGLRKLSVQKIMDRELNKKFRSFSDSVREEQGKIASGEADLSGVIRDGVDLVFKLRKVMAEHVRGRVQEVWFLGGVLLLGIFVFVVFVGYIAISAALGIVRSLAAIESGSRAFCDGQLDCRIKLEFFNEFQVVAGNFNSLADGFTLLLRQQQEESENSQAELERQVRWRTSELALANAELSSVVSALRLARDEAVERERMAALGNLVAGIAHEVNTPIGLAYTAITHAKDCLGRFSALLDADIMDRCALKELCGVSLNTVHYVVSNLERASTLIESFKQVAVDRSSDVLRFFNLETVLLEISCTLSPLLQKGEHQIIVNVTTPISMRSYPGALGQIVSNISLNAIKHGFEGRSGGVIEFNAKMIDDVNCQLSITDNGKGISPELVPRVFEPFFTTMRGRGGSGLGLHIAWNLVTQSLGGSISCSSELGNGCTFTLTFPVNVDSMEEVSNHRERHPPVH